MAFTAFFCFIQVSSSAQMYQYRNDNGNLCFTDDLTRIPQSKEDTLVAIPSFKYPSQMNVSSKLGFPLSEQALPENGADHLSGKKAQELNQIKEELNITYKLLQEKRQLIKNENPSEDSSPEEFSVFRKKVLEFNAEIASYQKRQEEFEKRVKEFNAQVK